MKTKLEHLAIELRSLAVGVEKAQLDLDKRDHSIESLNNQINTRDNQIKIMQDCAREIEALKQWTAVGRGTPPIDLEVLTKRKDGSYKLATYEGPAGWFIGNTKMETPLMWLLIPKR
jgi:predicted RNase H-like nuclease (RuvC/YqgF family)